MIFPPAGNVARLATGRRLHTEILALGILTAILLVYGWPGKQESSMEPCGWRRVLFIGICAASLAGASMAHHSTAEFDYTKKATIKGIVKEVQWTNPHSFIQLLVDGSNGGPQVQWLGRDRLTRLNINMAGKRTA